MADEEKQTGRERVRSDGRLKVTGRALYAGDVTIPGMCHAVLVQSTLAHGSVEAIDTAEARASEGVLGVFTYENLSPLLPPPEGFTAQFPAERRPPLADAEIHYAGQHLALVLGETHVQARAAAALVRVRYAPAKAVLKLQPGQPGTYEPDHFATNDKEKLKVNRGLPPAQPAHRITRDYRTNVVHHNAMEPSASVAAWTGDRLLIHDSTRWVQGSQKILAHMLGVPEEHVEVLAPFVGGAFGSKGFLWQHVALAAQAARIVRRPVKLVLDREQMFTSTGHRPRTQQSLVVATDSAGKLGSIEHHTLTETSPVAHFVEPAGMTSRNLYSTPHASISHHVARTNLATPCFMRAPGESPGMFALESAMDEMAEACGQDPLAFRLANYAERDEEEDRPWSSKHLRECYAIGAERFGWTARRPAPRSIRRRTGHVDKLVGWGMATAAYPARRSPVTVHATLGGDGQARFSAATHEIGTGTATVMEQIAADVLGLPVACIHFELGDSAYTQAPVAGASQTAASVGPAVQAAAAKLREQLILHTVGDARSALSGAAPSAIRLVHGVLETPDGRRESVVDVLSRLPCGQVIQAEGSAQPDKAAAEKYTFHSFGAHFCEVEVDAATAEVRVTRWVAVMDCGRILNPRTARSQVMGGIIFGIGFALLEQTIYDPGTGAPLTANLAEYLLPTQADVPEIDVQLVEEPDLHFNPLGIRGIGEIGITGVPAAIANAIYHATGVRVRSLPITADKLLAP